ncbi:MULTISPECIES: heme/hemin ABC transporter substrate-binding protein [unclassified Nocardioides]|uniref:heme/hemin ABC transporter substrate-binding protein n=1 Tax=unclassified Nocardioides TaxID=2615069 RepID=UPI000A41660A|nr:MULTISPECIES: ABC transporter substrate-binding protein [unclassified Nocardioides]
MRTAAVPTVVLLVAGALASCGLSAKAGSESGAGGGSSTTAVARQDAPPLADVTPLSDVRDWDGEVDAVADAPIDPVADDPEPALPTTVTDAQGTKVTVEDTSRILALDVYGTLSRTVFELGLGDRLVGRDVSTEFDEAKGLPLVTQNGHDLNAEAILGLDPTVIITDTSLGPWDVVLQMRDAGIPVVVVDSDRTLDNVAELIHQVADPLGVPQAGDALAQRTQRQIDQVTAQIANVAPSDSGDKLRMVFLYVRGQSGIYYMFGEGSGADSLIDAIGGYDVADEIGWNGMKPLTDEGLVAAQPDLVLMMSAGLESAGGVDGLLDRLPALANTPAGQHRRFVTMDDSQILGFGPITASVLNALAVAAYAPEEVR